MGGHCRSSSGFLSNALRLPHVRREEEGLAARAAQSIDMLDLGAVAQTPVADLPFGTQKRVELARALMSQPKLLLLDEPAGGLNHEEVDGLRQLLRRIQGELKLTILLVEHHMNLVMRVSDQVVALDFGRKIAEGTPAKCRATRTSSAPTSESPNERRDPQVRGLHAFYGSTHVLHGIDLEVRQGGITTSWAPTAPARRPRCARSAAW